jgi:hypothetical protein
MSQSLFSRSLSSRAMPLHLPRSQDGGEGGSALATVEVAWQRLPRCKRCACGSLVAFLSARHRHLKAGSPYEPPRRISHDYR